MDLESLGFSLYKCTRFGILAVLYTCTTVASRVAANACDTHLRFLTKPLSFPGLVSSPFLDSAERPCNKKSFRRNGLVNNCLLVPSPKANSALFVLTPKVTSHTSAENPFAPAKGFLKSGPRLPKRSCHSRPSNLWEHGEHTEVNSHKQFPLTWGTERSRPCAVGR